MTATKTINLDKQLPPQNIEAEEAVIGAIINNPPSLLKITEFLSASCFYKPQNKFIYEAVCSLMGAKIGDERVVKIPIGTLKITILSIETM